MNTIKSLIFAQDINKLNNNFLKEICEELDLTTTGNSNDLTARIMSNFNRIDETLLTKIEQTIFTGATSLAWYQAINDSGLNNFKQNLISKLTLNPFNSVINDYTDIGNDPVIIGAADIPFKNAFYLRLICKSTTSVDYIISQSRVLSRYDLITILVDLDKNILEIRASSKVAKKINRYIADIVDEFGYQFRQYDFLEAFDNNLANVADTLNGKLIDAQAKPSSPNSDIEKEKGEAVVSILSAIDSYYTEGEAAVIEQRLENENVREIMETTPFTVLLLSGLEKVGLGSIRELRGLPLYDYLDQYLQKEKGIILFEYALNGSVEEYSVKIGMSTKTFKFNVCAPEEVVHYVRELFIN